MKRLGIYFGLNAISIVEAEGRKITNQIQVPLPGVTEAKEQGLNVLIQDELNRHNIKTSDAIITLASKDLMVRSFDLPVLPKADLPAAVASEVTKYIPFKIEELVYDFKALWNKKEKRNYVLFAGIKSEELDSRYLSILYAAMLKPKQIEYAVFSLLKLLQTSRLKEKGAYAFVDIDLEDESNITILEDDFPQFSRTLKVPQELPPPAGPATIMEKVTNEIRVSLDFYRRKFPNKQVNQAIFLVKNELRYEVENLSHNLELTPKFINIPQELEREFHASLGLVKAYAASLDIKVPFEIDLLAGKERLRELKRKETEEVKITKAAVMEGIQIKKGIVFLGIIAIVAVYALLHYNKIIPLRKEIATVLSQRLPLSTVSTNLSYSELEAVNKNYNQRVSTLDKLVKQRQYLTPKLDYIPKLIPDGVWLTNLSFSEAQRTLSIKGAAYLQDYNAEVKAINEFVRRLTQNKAFNSTFNDIRINNMQQGEIGGIKITKFEINCTKK